MVVGGAGGNDITIDAISSRRFGRLSIISSDIVKNKRVTEDRRVR